MILALVLPCFPTLPSLDYAPAATNMVLGWGSLGNTHHFYFVIQPNVKIRSLVALN